MRLNELKDNSGSRKSRTRVGRGIGSGKGKTAGRGHKGQKSRSGVAIKGFEGGQMPLHRRLPKRGFKAPFSKYNASLRLSDIEKSGLDSVTKKTLIDSGLISKLTRNVKIFMSGSLTRSVKVEDISMSDAVKKIIEKAGGSVLNNKSKASENK